MPVAYIHEKYPLILASASPRRRELMSQTGIPFEVMISHVDENGVSGDPEQVTCILSEKKAREVYLRKKDFWVVGTDTVVVMDSIAGDETKAVILGKPDDSEDAARMLRLLSGKEHRVVTGFCIVDPLGKTVHREAVSTRVLVKELSHGEIGAYVRTKEPFDKAGSYAIQGLGAFMIKGIFGSYSNVVGLPLYSVIKSLVSVGALESYP